MDGQERVMYPPGERVEIVFETRPDANDIRIAELERSILKMAENAVLFRGEVMVHVDDWQACMRLVLKENTNG